MKYNENNVFYKILTSQLSCNKIFENDVALAFPDINPLCKVHILVITKGLYSDFADFAQNAPEGDVKKFFESVAEVAEKVGVAQSGYRVVSNLGRDAGQEVRHFHVHILGGEKLPSVLG